MHPPLLKFKGGCIYSIFIQIIIYNHSFFILHFNQIYPKKPQKPLKSRAFHCIKMIVTIWSRRWESNLYRNSHHSFSCFLSISTHVSTWLERIALMSFEPCVRGNISTVFFVLSVNGNISTTFV